MRYLCSLTFDLPVIRSVSWHQQKFTHNKEWLDIILFCLRKYEISVELISVYNVIEKLAEHGIHCLPCSRTYYVIYVSIATKNSYWCLNDVIETSLSQCSKCKCWSFCSCYVNITYLWRYYSTNSKGAWHTMYATLLWNYTWEANWNVWFSQTYKENIYFF